MEFEGLLVEVVDGGCGYEWYLELAQGVVISRIEESYLLRSEVEKKRRMVDRFGV